MRVEVIPATREDAPILANLAELYMYDFSAIMGWEIGADGRFTHAASVERQLVDPRRRAFLIRADGHLAGFAFVNRWSHLTDDPAVSDLTEFFILRRHRRRGVGEAAARAIFDRFPGRWEVRQLAENGRARTFWRAVVGRYTGGHYEEVARDDGRWCGTAQLFETPGGDRGDEE